jgi:hypothetical protein
MYGDWSNTDLNSTNQTEDNVALKISKRKDGWQCNSPSVK